MESVSSASEQQDHQVKEAATDNHDLAEKWFSERFESLLPKIQERWPDLAQQTIEATRGSLDELIKVISLHSGKNSYGVREQLEEVLNAATDKTKDLAESLEPLEKQLEEVLDELNRTIRPKIEKPVRKRPLLALGVATSIGVILGILISNGRRN
tara:strand:+ start:271 stop:735 length:465 start_codon:yes stop_codon:yes gene_type:complete